MNTSARPAAPSPAALSASAHIALAAPKGEVPTPCVKVCEMNRASGFCRGCWRTMREIAAWQNLDDAAKRQAWWDILARSKAGAGEA